MQAQIVQKSLGSEYKCRNKNIAHGPLEAELCRRIFGCSASETTCTKSKTLRTHPLGAKLCKHVFLKIINFKTEKHKQNIAHAPPGSRIIQMPPAPPSRLQPAASFPNPSSQVLPAPSSTPSRIAAAANAADTAPTGTTAVSGYIAAATVAIAAATSV